MENAPTENETLDSILRKVQANTATAAPQQPPFDAVEAGGEAVEADARRPRPDLLRGVHLKVRAELGRTRMLLKDALQLGPGSIVDLEKLAEDPVDLYVNELLIARGEVMVVNDSFCIRITEVITSALGEEEQ